MSLTWYRKTIGLLSSASRRGQRPPRRPRLLLGLEPLEGRVLPAIGTPIWVDQGPSSTGNPAPGLNFGATSQLQQNVGAIQAVAVNPFNANQVWVATVDGGVWRTTNATADSPTWTTTTDQLPFLGMGDIALSPLDSNNQPITAATPLNQLVLYAGNARVSSSFQQASAPAGLYKSTDGGTTWALISGTTFQNASIYSVVPTSIVDQVSNEQVVLVATDQGIPGGSIGGDLTPTNPLGLYRSVNGGTSWDQITNGLPAGGVRQVIADPGNPNRFYAAIAGQGVFRSDDGGVNWNKTANEQLTGIGNTTVNMTLRIELAVKGGNSTAIGRATGDGNGGVTGVDITDAGSGYTDTAPPTVTFSPPNRPGGIQATGNAIVQDGQVTGVDITNKGSGYDFLPTVTFSAPPTPTSSMPASSATRATAATPQPRPSLSAPPARAARRLPEPPPSTTTAG
jgi:hypothetical protein